MIESELITLGIMVVAIIIWGDITSVGSSLNPISLYILIYNQLTNRLSTYRCILKYINYPIVGISLQFAKDFCS